MKLSTTLFAAAAFAATTVTASAATLGLNTTGPLLSASDAIIDVTIDFGFVDIEAYTAIDGGSDPLAEPATDLFLSASFPFLLPVGFDSGILDVTDANVDTYLFGDLVDFGYTDTTLEFLFDVDQGSGTADTAFSPQVLLTFTAAALLPFSTTDTEFSVAGSMELQGIAAVPLPATIWLLGGALGLMAARSRKSARRS